MTAYAFSFFRNPDRISLIPVTSRSVPQFRRLMFPDVFRIQYAIVCNGGKLLLNGREDPEWTEETMAQVEAFIRHFIKVYGVMENE